MRVLMFCDFELPNSCADASRVFSFARMFRLLGYSVDILGVCYSGIKSTCGEYSGFKYKMITASSHRGIHAYKRISGIRKSLNTVLSQNTGENRYDIVFASNVYKEHDNVTFQETVLYGDLSAADGLNIKLHTYQSSQNN